MATAKDTFLSKWLKKSTAASEVENRNNITEENTSQKENRNITAKGNTLLKKNEMEMEELIDQDVTMNEIVENEENQMKKSLNRKNKFHDGWLQIKEFKGWLEKSIKKRDDSDLAYCRICDCTMTAHKSEIKRHSISGKHKRNEEKIVSSQKIEEVVQKNQKGNEIKRAEMKLAAFIAENNLPFDLMDSLIPLCKDIFPDSKIAAKLASKRTKTTKIIKKAIGNTFLEELYSKLKEKGNFFSIIMDETTDQSSIKQCALTTIYINDENLVKTQFFDMFEVKSGTAESLYKSLKESIISKGIPFENMVGFSSDTTNVMVGEHNSVFSHLQKECPGIACIKCSCHMIHLAASKACMKLPKHVEDLLRNLGSHFSRSYGRQLSFQEFQEFFHVEIHKILSPATTRWLSLKQCVDRVLEQYEVLKSYMTQLCFDDPSYTNQTMLDTLNNAFTKIYLEFMEYILGVLCDFNVMFQEETPLLHRVKPEVEKLLKDICSNFIEVNHVKETCVFNIKHTDKTLYLPIKDIYIGIQATESIQELKNNPDVPEKDINYFFLSIQNFYIELVTVIKEKFDFKDELYNIISIADPQVAQEFRIKSLQGLLIRFPVLKNCLDSQLLDNEWKKHALLDHGKEGLDPSKPANIYWKNVFNMKTSTGVPIFPNLKIAINMLLILPFSNASVERVFSMLKNCKTAHRNRLKTETIVSLIATKEGVKNQNGCVKFEPSKKMLTSKLWD